MWGRLGKIALSLPFLIVAGLFGLYLAFGFFLVDPLAKKRCPGSVKTSLQAADGATGQVNSRSPRSPVRPKLAE